MNIKTIFGENLRFYRKRTGLSQEQISEILNITNKHLSELETGKSFVSAELLEKISEVLHVSPSSLFYSPEEKSLDESDWSKIEEIITEEAEKAVVSAKVRISELHHFSTSKTQS